LELLFFFGYSSPSNCTLGMLAGSEALLGAEASVGKKRYQRYYVMGGTAACLIASAFAGFLAGRATSSPLPTGMIDTIGCPIITNASKQLWTPRLNPIYEVEMLAKSAVRKFDQYLMFQAAFDTPQRKLQNVRQWLADDFVYETVGFPGAKSAAEWCLSGEEAHFRTTFNISEFTQMLFFGTDSMATTTSYGTVFWAEPLMGIPAPKKWTRFRVIDFYRARKTGPNQAHLYWNFMMIDFVDLLRRSDIHVLPPPVLPDGYFLPPYKEDGVPAPLSVLVKPWMGPEAIKICRVILEKDWAGNEPSGLWAQDVVFYGPGGIGMANGITELEQHVLQPFRKAFADRSLDIQIFDCEGLYCAATGFIKGRHVNTWVGLDASNRQVALRFAFHWRVHGGMVEGGWAVFDMPDFFAQLGLDFWGRARELAAAKGASVKTDSA